VGEGSHGFSEEVLARIESARDPGAIPELVRTIRQQQRELDNLRLSMDVARRDREELRSALLECRGKKSEE
jgi:hypothetical protein